MVTKSVTVAPYACCYGRMLLLPAWVCMSIRLPMFSVLHCDDVDVVINVIVSNGTGATR